jgi:hypothetical protein
MHIDTIGEDWTDRRVDEHLAAMAGVSMEEWTLRTLRRNITIDGRIRSRECHNIIEPMRAQLVGRTAIFLGDVVGQMFGMRNWLSYDVEGEDWVMVPVRWDQATGREIVSLFLRDLLWEQSQTQWWHDKIHGRDMIAENL